MTMRLMTMDVDCENEAYDEYRYKEEQRDIESGDC